MSQVDQKRAFNKMKHDLEPIRNVVMCIDNLLTWKKNYYPSIVVGSITLFYLLLWYLDMSAITMLSLMGLMAILLDFLYPTLIRLVNKGDEWSGIQEARFDHIVEQLFSLKMQLIEWYEYIFTNEPKSAMFVVVIGSALLMMAWFGAIINNYLLMYVITLATALYPGVADKDILRHVKQQICCLVSQMRNVRKIEQKED